jgi:carbon-monoxide dehydrogenase large subunit
MDYAIARAEDLPAIEIVACNRPNSLTPAGLKGMAEGGVMGSIGALSNAISDALSQLGVVAEDQPFTPDRVRSWITENPAVRAEIGSNAARGSRV